MFPNYHDWDVAYTPRGLLKRRIQQALSYAVLAAIVACVAIARVSGIGIMGLAKGLLPSLLTSLEYGAISCRERLNQYLQI